ncbi:hypothetical protein QAD02_006039 [Eretmocerus hayati]|uniref:Uncharacterized protein n=1 Tax=Eretmocerus hayati TaxID=131215 RepID=A0ACC2N219_9HYME|nr:hypothetical protein QAD02_006039 [Eretmocerus hayati]
MMPDRHFFGSIQKKTGYSLHGRFRDLPSSAYYHKSSTRSDSGLNFNPLCTDDAGRLDIRGRVKILHGQNRKTEEPPLALFALCTPFGPPSLLEVPQKEVMFKSKHKLDLALVSMDQRGKMLLGYSDAELANLGGYDLVHFDDLAYVASAHQELLKTGASGMIAYRYQTKENGWQWLQTSSRLVYKNSKPDFVISTHRPLMEEEGRDLLGKRTMDFKVSYLDAGLTNSYFSDSDSLGSTAATVAPNSQLSPSTTPSVPVGSSMLGPMTAATSVDYLGPTATGVDASAAVVAAAAYGNLNSLPYPGAASYAAPATAVPETGHLGAYISHATAPTYHHQTLYPTSALDNRYLTAATENLFQYRALESGRSTSGYGSLLSSDRGTLGTTSVSSNSAGSSPATVAPNSGGQTSSHNNNNSGGSSSGSGNNNNGMLTPKLEEASGTEPLRQTVLMWGAPPAPPHQPRSTPPTSNGTYSPPVTPRNTNLDPHSDPLKSLQEMNSLNGECKWKRSSPVTHATPSPPRPKPQQAQQHYPPITSTVATHYSGASGYAQQQDQSQSHSAPEPEVWQGVQHQPEQHHHYQYYPYHPTAPPRHASHNSSTWSSVTGHPVTVNECYPQQTISNTKDSNDSCYQQQADLISSAIPIASALESLNRTQEVLCCPSPR